MIRNYFLGSFQRGRLAGRLSFIAIAFLLLATTSALFNAQAATPSSGTISDTNPGLTYTAGPFLTPNVTGNAGPVICNSVTVCDDFALTVAGPASYLSTMNVTVKISWANAVADFDLYLLDSAGNVVKESASSSDPEIVVLQAAAGNYTVRVVPYAPLGESFNATVGFTAKPVNPPPGTAQIPTYSNYTPPAGSGLGTRAGEPSIGVNPKTGKVLYQASLQTLRVSFDDTVSPAAATWENKSAPSSVTSLDAILFTDQKTGRAFVSQLVVAGSLSSYTDDDGNTWTPTQGSGIASGVDHQTIGGGSFAPGTLTPLLSYKDIVYYCSQDIGDALCASSLDGGLTYGPAIPIYNVTQCGGLHGHVKVAPDGTAYVPNKGCGGNQAVVVSTDNGLTWQVRPVPGSIAGQSDPSVGIGSDGTVYFGYQNGDGHPRIAVSHDKGLTWVNDQDVGTTFGIQNTAFPAVVAGDPDRGAFAFLGTPTAGNYQDQSTFQGVWHLYVAHTYDSGKSWVTADATPNDPVQRGSIWLGGGSHQDRNLLDFMDATVDGEGRMLVGYADGCIGACVQAGPNSFSRLATIARETTGGRLFAKYDLPDLSVTNIVANYSHNKGNSLTATVTNTGTGNATGAVVRFLDGSTLIADSAPVDVPSGATVSVTIPWDTHGLKGYRSITAIVDPDNKIPEANENNNQLTVSINSRL